MMVIDSRVLMTVMYRRHQRGLDCIYQGVEQFALFVLTFIYQQYWFLTYRLLYTECAVRVEV